MLSTPYLWEHSHRRLHVGIENGAKHSLKKWCEALFEKIGCRKFALILEKPEIDENLPTPLSWDAKLTSTRKAIESSDFPRDGFRRGIKRGFWKVSACSVHSGSRNFPQTCPEMMKK